MDKIIRLYDSSPDGELTITRKGIAYQSNMDKAQQATYDGRYFGYCESKYSDKEFSGRINKARLDLVAEYGDGLLLDIGIGNGDFLRARGGSTYGFDIDPEARAYLRKEERWSDEFDIFGAFTMWDVLEHCKEPQSYLKRIKPGSYLFLSLPIFDDLKRVRESHHYRPNEHFYYFTREGLVGYLNLYGFELVRESDEEEKIGRKQIRSFVFKRTHIDFGHMVKQYGEIHASKFYGASSKLYFSEISGIVRRKNPASILDYGCGRSDLVTYFWKDGERKIYKYDPAIPDYKVPPVKEVDMVLCNDVLEHIRLADLERVLTEIRGFSRHVIFTISTIPSRAKLPDGQNAHVTLLTKSEWRRWIEGHFDRCEEVPTQWPHIMLCKTFPR